MEYSCLIIARIREEDGFKDVHTYADMKWLHDFIVARPNLWREYARYYGVIPPAELRGDADSDADAAESDETPPLHL